MSLIKIAASPALIGVSLGAGIGAALGGLGGGTPYRDPQGKRKTVPRWQTALSGAGLGAMAGGSVGAAIGSHMRFKKSMENAEKFKPKFYEDFNKEFGGGRSRYTPPPPKPPGGGHRHSDYKREYYTPPKPPDPPQPDTFKSFFGGGHGEHADHTSFKTKKEAQAHYRKLAQKFHPDLAPNASTRKFHEEKMKNINNEWDKIKGSGWFEKLAQLVLRRRNTR